MHYQAIIPVKTLTQAKSRLTGYLSLEQRRQLVLTMLRHVLLVLQESDIHITVVSADAEVCSYARSWGAQTLNEEQPGHNPALTAAAQHILSEIPDVDKGHVGLLTISADLPLLQVDEIQAMIEASKEYPVVLAASQEGTGTNALLVHPPLNIPYVFGQDSLQHYLNEATKWHLPTKIQKSHGLSFDIDTIDDLELLQMYAWEYRAMQQRVDEAYSLSTRC
ncbi:MAG TPA: 2-phospho-L-lactate guanylyltransferase [Ktedonobacter sp.]|nr:2-phospho-L-lactate guanylyltransferase [Ktedonobacter sp.]